MNTKHTPGPWKWEGEFGEANLRARGEPDDVDGCVLRYAPYEGMWFGSYGAKGEDEANARVIAAAPDLLWALEQIIGDLPTNRDWLDPNLEAFARNAIAKANGAAA